MRTLAKSFALLLLATYAWPAPSHAADDLLCPSFYEVIAGKAAQARDQLDDWDAATGRIVSRTAKYVNQMARAPVPSVPEKDQSFFRKALSFVGARAKTVGRALVPFPLPAGAKNEAEQIYAELWANPKMVLSAAQKNVLARQGVYLDFLNRQNFLLAHPASIAAKKAFRFTVASLELTATAAAVNQAYQLEKNAQTADRYLDAGGENPDGSPVVQLLVETTPFPHAALRIGDKVYSYGQEFMSARSVYEYLQQADDSGPADRAAGFTKTTQRALSRSLRVTDLHLSPEEVNRLRRELEMNTGKVYRNTTLVNDCSTMIKRALEKDTDLKIPTAIDAAPSVTSAYLSVRHTLGDPRVGETRLILMNPSDSKAFHVARDTYIAMMEARVVLMGATQNLPMRAWVSARYSDGELQYHTPEEQAQIDGWKKEARAAVDAEFNSIFDGREFFSAVAKLPPAERAARIQAAEEALDLVTKRLEGDARGVLDYPGAEFPDLISAAAKEEATQRLAADYRARLAAIPPK